MSEQQIVKSVSPDGSTATVAVGEALTIETSGEFHRALTDAMATVQRVVLDVHSLEAIDMTALQVICSACKTASSLQRRFELQGEVPACLLSLSREIGASQNVPSCCQDANKPCIWFGGAR